MINYFLKSAGVKEQVASLFDKSPAQPLTAIRESSARGGTIYIASDFESRFSADHLAEELQVRFRAGKSFGREDRGAVSAISLAPYQLSDLAAIVKGRLTADDFLIVFSCSDAAHAALDSAAAAAEEKKIARLFVGKGAARFSGPDPTQLGIAIETQERGIQFSAQRAALHAICEPFEPEFKTGDDAKYLTDIFRASAALDRAIAADAAFISLAERTAAELRKRIDAGSPLYFFGNGGSACDADELAQEFRGRTDSHGAPIIATSFLQQGYLTCAVNDGFPLFKRGVEGIPSGRGIVVAFSTSGQSANVTDAVAFARQKNILAIGFIGKGGGKMAAEVDYALTIPSQTTERIQEAHTVLGFWLAAQFSK